MGYGTPSLAEGTEYEMVRLSYNYWLMLVLYRNHWLARNIVDVPAEDMTRSWAKITSQLPPDDIQRFDRAIERTYTPSKVEQALKWSRLYGGAGCLICIKGHEKYLDEPLDLDDVDPHSYKGLIPFDRWVGIWPDGDLSSDMDHPVDFGLPEYYRVQASESGNSWRVHCSRILRFLGPEVPKPELQAQLYWGISVLEPAYEAIRMFDNSLWSMLQLLFRANILAQTNKDLAEMLSGLGISTDALQQFYARMEAQNMLMSNQSMMILPEGGDLKSVQYSFSGLEGVIGQYVMIAAGASGIPQTRLFGRTMTGLGQSNDADERYYEERIGHDQSSRLKPQLMKVYPVICMSEFGEVPDDLDLSFPSIRVLTETEKAEMAEKGSAPVIAAFNVGAFGQKTLLKELHQLSDATGIFSNITEEQIDKASDEPQGQGEMGGMEGLLGPGGGEGEGGEGGQEPESGAGGEEGGETPGNEPEDRKTGGKRRGEGSEEASGKKEVNHWPAFGPKGELKKLSAGAEGGASRKGMRRLEAGATDSEMPGPDAEGTEEDVDALMERRSFGLVGKRPGDTHGSSFAVYQRHGGSISVLVRFLDGKVRDATLTQNASETGKEPRVQTKKGFKGLFQFAQSVGDAHPIKKRLTWHGLDVSIETPAGEVRSGQDSSGRPWRVVMTHDYGYLLGTRGVDGDHVDVFVGPDKKAAMVYVVHTMKAPEFEEVDEDKCFLDFQTDGAARTAFFSNYDRPEHFGSMDAIPVGEFIDKVLATRRRPSTITADDRSWGRRIWDAIRGADADFNESEHPREEAGKFTVKGSVKSGGTKAKKSWVEAANVNTEPRETKNRGTKFRWKKEGESIVGHSKTPDGRETLNFTIEKHPKMKGIWVLLRGDPPGRSGIEQFRSLEGAVNTAENLVLPATGAKVMEPEGGKDPVVAGRPLTMRQDEEGGQYNVDVGGEPGTSVKAVRPARVIPYMGKWEVHWDTEGVSKLFGDDVHLKAHPEFKVEVLDEPPKPEWFAERLESFLKREKGESPKAGESAEGAAGEAHQAKAAKPISGNLTGTVKKLGEATVEKAWIDPKKKQVHEVTHHESYKNDPPDSVKRGYEKGLIRKVSRGTYSFRKLDEQTAEAINQDLTADAGRAPIFLEFEDENGDRVDRQITRTRFEDAGFDVRKALNRRWSEYDQSASDSDHRFLGALRDIFDAWKEEQHPREKSGENAGQFASSGAKTEGQPKKLKQLLADPVSSLSDQELKSVIDKIDRKNPSAGEVVEAAVDRWSDEKINKDEFRRELKNFLTIDPGERKNVKWFRPVELYMNDEFRDAFGDSQVRDENGFPLTLYRGTKYEDAFHGDNQGRVMFSTNPIVGKNFSASMSRAAGKSRVVQCYLKMENPLVVDAKWIEAGRNPEFINRAWKESVDGGHDGLIIKNINESGYAGDDYIVSNRNQIIEDKKAPSLIDADFKESEHPREEAGKFTSKGGGSSSGGPEPEKAREALTSFADRSEWPEHVKALKVPPGWKDVKVAANPDADLLATGKDDKGRSVYIYAERFKKSHAAIKYARIKSLETDMPLIERQLAEKQKNEAEADLATCARLVMSMGVRPGSDKDTQAEVKAYGATTLEGKHVAVDGDEVRLRFTGKKGVAIDLPVTDPDVAADLKARAAKAGPDGKLFGEVTDSSLRDFVHGLDHGGYSSKDFRTLKGCMVAKKQIESMTPPKTEKEYKKSVMEVGRKVSSVLGNTPVVAIQSYVNPELFGFWRSTIGI